MNFIDENEDWEESARTREVKGWTVEQRDPYGFFWFVKKGKKAIPVELSGAYTTLTKVDEAITHYEHNKDKTPNAP
jgi:hypothetical protein